MINVFISVPMRGRKKENIEYSIHKMKRIARAYLADSREEEENINFINTMVTENPPSGVDRSIWYLGASIQLLAKADFLVTVWDVDNNPGCEIELQTFKAYKGNKFLCVDNSDILAPSEKELSFD